MSEWTFWEKLRCRFGLHLFNWSAWFGPYAYCERCRAQSHRRMMWKDKA